MCFFQLFTTIPLFFKKQLLLDEFHIGAVMAVNGVGIVLFEMVLVFKLEGKRAYLQLIHYGTILMGCAFLLLNLPLQNGLIVALSAILMLTLAEMVAMPFMNSYYIERSSEQSRGRYAAMYTMAWSLAQVVGSTLGAALVGVFGFRNLWFVTCLICFITAAGYFRLQRKG